MCTRCNSADIFTPIDMLPNECEGILLGGENENEPICN